MRKILIVAKRDFLATVNTKGFIITMIVPPLMWVGVILLFPRLMSNRVPPVSGTVVLVDPTGQVAPAVRRYLSPQAIAERRDATFSRAIDSGPMAGATA